MPPWQVRLVITASLIITVLLAAALSVTPAGDSSSTSELGHGWVLAVITPVFTVVALPLAEEIIFRRLLLDWLLARTSAALAFIVVTVAFAAIHVTPPVMLYILVCEGFWTLLRIWYASLWASWIAHMCNNALVTGAALVALLST
ncbi:CPBP family intramembrane metalloprotease [Kocuria sp. JC486]|uniref:CPBP family intramembrane glutamic endopeptidase n=1 Tax=Kocuria sp. JC486 TaxID=1970736 RepID=UPI001421A48A|nr:CPBP family intramembrane glutamic endopeptidase [Kocuria sp. JC486]NHU86082.1 CPBP family intramembrane metalloprotease [Kocuria sp. JC486]